MAATIAKAIGPDDMARTKQVHQSGSLWSEGQANTFRTFTTCFVLPDGSGYLKVVRDGGELARVTFGPE